MIELYTCCGQPATPTLSDDTLPPDVVWIDLLSATPEETVFVERVTGLTLPSRAELSEIESSSRLRSDRKALYLSAPLTYRMDTGEPQVSPVGFVLTRERLVTVRYAELKAFDSFRAAAVAPDSVHPSSAGAFVGLIEAIVDRVADVLEAVGTDLDTVSHRVFRDELSGRRRRPAREDADLRDILRRVGRAGDLISKIRDGLLGVGRIVPYVTSLTAAWLPAELKPRLDTLRHDITSLNDYDGHLANKVQLLLDATLGLINIEQNNIIKVLTIVSVVGVPPTLVASMYGMNFKLMPELEWTYGYPYGLTLIALSAILPIVWFKLRGWL